MVIYLGSGRSPTPNAFNVIATREIDDILHLYGSAAYRSSLPLTSMLEALERAGVPAAISNHAGTFLCNHLFYLARHQVEQLDIPCRCGFIHVPGVSTGIAGDTDCGLPLSLLIDGIEHCLDVLRATRTSPAG